MKFKIGIIGAGPAGLVTALGLEEYCKNLGSDLEITLIDKNKSAYDYPGVEYGIQARACLALRRIGIKDEALARGLSTNSISFYNARTNKIQNQKIKTDPDLTVTVVRQEFLSDLNDLLKTTVIKRELNVTSITATEDNVKVECNNSSGAIETYDFDLLIAADGIASITRRQYFKDQNYIHNRGFSCLYMLIDVPDNAPEHIKQSANDGESSVVLGQSTIGTFFSLGKNRIAVGIGFDDTTKKEIWNQVGASDNKTWTELDIVKKIQISSILAKDCAFKDNMLQECFEWIPDWNSYKIYLWSMRDSDIAVKPYNEFGNIIMIGDAAHAIMPTIGMGASLAIEDAEILAKHISTYLVVQKSTLKDTLVNYTKIRLPIWKELTARSRIAARLNFINVKNKSRLSFGPQVPVKFLWRVIAKIEELMN